VLAGAVTGIAPATASAAACESWTGAQPLSPGTLTQLSSVAVLSPCDAWAAGFYSSGGASLALIEHWNGANWKVVASPEPGTAGNVLSGIRAASPSSIWAVGSYFNTTGGNRTLILHWDGHAWQQVTSPSPGDSDNLRAVRAVSASDVWAVGGTFNGTVGRALILHWNGHTWKQATIPSTGTASELAGVAASSASNVWAVGESETTSSERTLVLHWNGRRWAQQASPSPGGSNSEDSLAAVGVSSAGNAWAVGTFTNGGIDNTLTLHWNGHKWARVTSPNRGGSASGNSLAGVAIVSGRDAWAVGSYVDGSGTAQNVLLLHWNGSTWQMTAGPRPAIRNAFTAVAASSSGNVWAAGFSDTANARQALAFHCC
jgi:hypothetical protein